MFLRWVLLNICLRHNFSKLFALSSEQFSLCHAELQQSRDCLKKVIQDSFYLLRFFSRNEIQNFLEKLKCYRHIDKQRMSTLDFYATSKIEKRLNYFQYFFVLKKMGRVEQNLILQSLLGLRINVWIGMPHNES